MENTINIHQRINLRYAWSRVLKQSPSLNKKFVGAFSIVKDIEDYIESRLNLLKKINK